MEYIEELSDRSLCQPLFNPSVLLVINHVELKHKEKEFVVFMTADDFFDFLGKRCSRCQFLFLNSNPHSDKTCAKYQRMKTKHSFTNFEINRILQKMVSGSLLVENKKAELECEKGNDLKVKKRKRRDRRPKTGTKGDGSASATSCTDGYEADSHMEEGSSEEDGPLIKRQRRLPTSATLYLRCPVQSCSFKTLRPERATDYSDVLYHMRADHLEAFVIFNRTKMPHSQVG